MQRLDQAMQAQRVAINQVPVNEQAVRAAAAQVATVQADLAVAQARVHADIWNILTPEQQTKAKELEQQAQARARERQQRAPRAPKQPV
jgi:Spy/CpxP family protein refolding chaperone